MSRNRQTLTRAAHGAALVAMILLATTSARAASDSSGARDVEAGRNAAGSGTDLTVEFDGGEIHTFTEEEKTTIREIAAKAFDEVRAILPALDPSLTLSVGAGSRVIPETGDVGASVAPGRITWTVDPARPGGVAAVARKRLRPTLFHELHHQVRGWVMQGGEPLATFMEAPVSEGLATAFERDAAGSEPPWGDYPDDAAAWVDELKTLSVREGFAGYSRWMFAHEDGRRWIGYRAGTYIADRAIANSGRSAADLVSVPVDEILRLAGVAGEAE